MKLLTILLTILTLQAAAQSDSARRPIRLQFTQDHIAYMGAELQQNNTLSDHRLYDTLSARIGSGTRPDSVTTATYTAGFVLRFIGRVVDEQGGTVYVFLDQLLSGKTGYTGLIAQLNAKVQAGGAEGLTARWLRRELQELLARKAAPLTEKKKQGATYLTNPLEYN